MKNYTITEVPEDEHHVPIYQGTESVEYEFTEAGNVVDRVDTAGPDTNVMTPERMQEIAEQVMRKKAIGLQEMKRHMLLKQRLVLRAPAKAKAKSKNRKKNKAARASRKKNR